MSKEAIEKMKTEYPIVMANKMIQETQYYLTPNEYNITRYLIMKINKNDKEIKPVIIPLKEFCELMGVNPNYSGNYSYIRDVVLRLARKMAYAPFTKEEEGIVYWIEPGSVRLNKHKGYIKLQLAKIWEPYLIDLKEYYAKTYLEELLPMKSIYGKRMYELAVSCLYANNRDSKASKTYTIDEFKDYMVGTPEIRKRNEATKDKASIYKRFADFRKKVIEVAKSDLDKYGKVHMTYELIKTGRTYTEITLNFRWNTVEEQLEKTKAQESERKNRKKLRELEEKTAEIEEAVELEEVLDPEEKDDPSEKRKTYDYEEHTPMMVREEGIEYGVKKEAPAVLKADWIIYDKDQVLGLIEEYKGVEKTIAERMLEKMEGVEKLPDHYVVKEKGKETLDKIMEYQDAGIEDYEMISEEEYEMRKLVGAFEKMGLLKR